MTKTNCSIGICVFLLFAIFSAQPCFPDETLSGTAKHLETATLQLKWKHQFQFAGYYAALEKGFYRKAGLDVKILEAKDGVDSMDLVIKGEVDFGIAMSDLILHRAKDQPVVALASIFQHSPLIILTPKASGIENIHALKRKRIAMEAHSAELLAYFEFEGVPLKDIEIFPHEFSVSNLISGKVDAISAYSTDEPFVLLNTGIEYNVFSPRSAGIDFYGDTLFTSEKKVHENPELVSAFLGASLEGWRYALNNTEEIIDLILSKYTRRHSREHLLFEARMSKKLIMADVVELGYMNIGRWEHIARTYEKLRMIDSDFSLEGFVYAPRLEADYTWVKRVIGAAAGASLLVGIGVLFLLFFNKKLKNEIEERKKTEKALTNSEEKYKAFFNNAQVALFRSRISDGKLLEINERYANMAGYADIGDCVAEFNAAEAWADLNGREEMLAAIKKNGFVLDYETEIIRRDGVSIWIIFSATSFPEQGYLEGSIVDVTERKQAEKERDKLQAQLLQTQKMESIGNLAGGIAHDFNNILSSIIGFTELALDDVKKETPLEDNLQEVYTAGKRARDLVKQILAFARQSDEERKPTQVDTIAKEVLKLIRSTIPTTIEIKANLESHSLIMGNPSRVHQLFMNLCTNAAQAMEDNGGVLEVSLKDIELNEKSPLKLSALKPGNYMKVTILDTGPGIMPDIINSIFEPYFTTKGVGEGTGMGLALAHGIVESHGGKIIVDSELGKGSVFSIYLPTTKKREDQRAYEKEELPSGTERILFVDDELPVAKIGSQILERLGYQVTIRTSSVEALELFRSKPNDFDLVITDMTMPNMTGDDLAVELMGIRADTPVILCTGYSKTISDKTSKDIGIKAFAYKPIVKADLAKTVRKTLDEAKGSAQK